MSTASLGAVVSGGRMSAWVQEPGGKKQPKRLQSLTGVFLSKPSGPSRVEWKGESVRYQDTILWSSMRKQCPVYTRPKRFSHESRQKQNRGLWAGGCKFMCVTFTFYLLVCLDLTTKWRRFASFLFFSWWITIKNGCLFKSFSPPTKQRSLKLHVFIYYKIP